MCGVRIRKPYETSGNTGQVSGVLTKRSPVPASIPGSLGFGV